MTRLWPILLSLTALSAAEAATIVRCESNGRVTYQNVPCPAAAQSREVEAANVELPPVDTAAVEARRAAFLAERQRAARDAELARLADAQADLARTQQRQAATLDALADEVANQPTVVYGGYGGYGGYPQGKWNRPGLPKHKPEAGRPDGGYDRPTPYRDRGNAASAIDRAVQRAVAQRIERNILDPGPGARR